MLEKGIITDRKDPAVIAGFSVLERKIFEVKLTGAVCIFLHHMVISTELILIGDQSWQTDRPAGVEFSGADTDLCRKSIPETVGESCRTIMINAGAVD